MKVLIVNVPFVKRDQLGRIRTGPNAGSRWPFTLLGYTDYAPFPFFMAYAVTYLKHFGVDATFYDAVACKDWDLETVKTRISRDNPDVLVLEAATPTFKIIEAIAKWARKNLRSRIVMVGPHVRIFANIVIQQGLADHCIVGEYEHPLLEIIQGRAHINSVHIFDHVADINEIEGSNFVPFRSMENLNQYWDPSMATSRPQLQVNTSRGCPYKCTYCQWPAVMYNYTYRVRKPALVIDEIKTTMKAYRTYFRSPQILASVIRDISRIPFNILKSLRYRRIIDRDQWFQTNANREIRSILFDDDTWNVGDKRVTALCAGLKDIGIPWTMMGRTDTVSMEIYDRMVESGCVGMRFGIESFQQRLLDSINKKMDARRNYETIRYLITRFSGLEFHFTTMNKIPGQTKAEWLKDQEILKELKKIGESSGNRVHWQISNCVPFPGTKMWEDMVESGIKFNSEDLSFLDGGQEN